MRRKACYN